jgi:gluconolactonase
MRSLWSIGIVLAAAVPATAQDMNLTQILLPGEEWHAAPVECKSAAGLVGDGRGNVYVADGKQIWRIDKDNKASVFAKTDGVVHRLAVGPDGRVFAAEPDKKRVVQLDADGKEVGKSEGDGVRDLVVSKQGAIYGTLADGNGVYLFHEGKKRQVAEGIASPGALALWSDGGTLIVGDAGDKYLYAFRVQKDGNLDAKERYYPFWVRPEQPSDNAGLALDAAGRAYATSREGVQVFDPTGRLSGIMIAPERAALGGVAFGGADLDRLYVACGGKVYMRKMLAKGVRAGEQKGP